MNNIKSNTPQPSAPPVLAIFNSYVTLEHFFRTPPPCMPPLNTFAFLLTPTPLEQITSLLSPCGFSEVIAYYLGARDAKAILTKNFPNSRILVYELPDGQAWPPKGLVLPKSNISLDDLLNSDDIPFVHIK